ncbi:uncharacterized protein LOC101854009 isoform X2 [Aplysia californica]|uniref:Uncharacterized protein LOC101854009 isoform X2 n=1 Tax=Aplysia californica TaxID=6500 RepID=A0ABM0JJX4_APLCA|nr:uncharacterized protein LOC101854009 isoform X2 [Aplysia californica]
MRSKSAVGPAKGVGKRQATSGKCFPVLRRTKLERGSLVKAKSSLCREKSPTKQAKTPVCGEKSPARQTKSPLRGEKASARQVKSPASREKSPAKQGKSPVCVEKSLTKQCKSPVRGEKSSTKQVKSPATREKSPEKQGKSQVGMEKSPAKQGKSQGGREKSPGKQVKSPAFTEKSPPKHAKSSASASTPTGSFSDSGASSSESSKCGRAKSVVKGKASPGDTSRPGLASLKKNGVASKSLGKAKNIVKNKKASKPMSKSAQNFKESIDLWVIATIGKREASLNASTKVNILYESQTAARGAVKSPPKSTEKTGMKASAKSQEKGERKIDKSSSTAGSAIQKTASGKAKADQTSKAKGKKDGLKSREKSKKAATVQSEQSRKRKSPHYKIFRDAPVPKCRKMSTSSGKAKGKSGKSTAGKRSASLVHGAENIIEKSPRQASLIAKAMIAMEQEEEAVQDSAARATSYDWTETRVVSHSECRRLRWVTGLGQSTSDLGGRGTEASVGGGSESAESRSVDAVSEVKGGESEKPESLEQESLQSTLLKTLHHIGDARLLTEYFRAQREDFQGPVDIEECSTPEVQKTAAPAKKKLENPVVEKAEKVLEKLTSCSPAKPEPCRVDTPIPQFPVGQRTSHMTSFIHQPIAQTVYPPQHTHQLPIKVTPYAPSAAYLYQYAVDRQQNVFLPPSPSPVPYAVSSGDVSQRQYSSFSLNHMGSLSFGRRGVNPYPPSPSYSTSIHLPVQPVGFTVPSYYPSCLTAVGQQSLSGVSNTPLAQQNLSGMSNVSLAQQNLSGMSNLPLAQQNLSSGMSGMALAQQNLSGGVSGVALGQQQFPMLQSSVVPGHQYVQDMARLGGFTAGYGQHQQMNPLVQDNSCMPPPSAPPPPSPHRQAAGSQGVQPTPVRPRPVAHRPAPSLSEIRSPEAQRPMNPVAAAEPLAKLRALDLSAGRRNSVVHSGGSFVGCQPAVGVRNPLSHSGHEEVESKAFVFSSPPAAKRRMMMCKLEEDGTSSDSLCKAMGKSVPQRGAGGNAGQVNASVSSGMLSSVSSSVSDVLHSAHSTVYQQDQGASVVPHVEDAHHTPTPSTSTHMLDGRSNETLTFKYSVSSILDMPSQKIKSEPQIGRVGHVMLSSSQKGQAGPFVTSSSHVGRVGPVVTSSPHMGRVGPVVTSPPHMGRVGPVVTSPPHMGRVGPVVTSPHIGTSSPHMGRVGPVVTSSPHIGTSSPHMGRVGPVVISSPHMGRHVGPVVTSPPHMGRVGPVVTSSPHMGRVGPEVSSSPQMGQVLPAVSLSPQMGHVGSTVSSTPQTGHVGPVAASSPQMSRVGPDVASLSSGDSGSSSLVLDSSVSAGFTPGSLSGSSKEREVCRKETIVTTEDKEAPGARGEGAGRKDMPQASNVIVIEDSDDTSDDEPLANLVKMKCGDEGNDSKSETTVSTVKGPQKNNKEKTKSRLDRAIEDKTTVAGGKSSLSRGKGAVKKAEKTDNKRVGAAALAVADTGEKTGRAGVKAKPDCSRVVLKPQLNVNHSNSSNSNVINNNNNNNNNNNSAKSGKLPQSLLEGSKAAGKETKAKSSVKKSAKVQGTGKKCRPETQVCPSPSKTSLAHGWSWLGEGELKAIPKLTMQKEEPLRYRKCFQSMRHTLGEVVSVRDCVILHSDGDAGIPYVAKVSSLWETPTGEMMLSMLWYYQPEHTAAGREPEDGEQELFASKHREENSVACIDDKCYVLMFNEYCRLESEAVRTEQGVPLPLWRQKIPQVSEADSKLRRPLPHPDTCVDNIWFCRFDYDIRKKIVKKPKDKKSNLRYSRHRSS